MKKVIWAFFLILLGIGAYYGYSFYRFPHQPYGPQAVIEVKKGMMCEG